MDKMEATLDDPYILITDKKISNIQEILPLLEQIVQSGAKMCIRDRFLDYSAEEDITLTAFLPG